MLTIIDVMKRLRIEPTPELTWRVGTAVRVAYENKHGRLPEKGLRKKTSGPGSHCFALYSPSFVPVIEKIIRAHRAEKKRQGDLPF